MEGFLSVKDQKIQEKEIENKRTRKKAGKTNEKFRRALNEADLKEKNKRIEKKEEKSNTHVIQIWKL